ncbi:MAG: DUF1284 domain-containing protein [Lachnospiraceae bacterium]|nr:DUF1284 domain-containing protein [Lachnospiraceae bacterium]
MTDIKSFLEETNPYVKIVNNADDICSMCPKRDGNNCMNIEDIEGHDKRVWNKVREDLAKLAEKNKENVGAIKDTECPVGKEEYNNSYDFVCVRWNTISNVIKNNIIDSKLVKDVCIKCRWSDICFNKS